MTTVGLALSAFLALGSLSWPLGRDQANLTWVGQVILHGGVPYKDAWDIKGPLSYYTAALGVSIFGDPTIASRVPDLVAVLASCVTLRRLVLRVTGGDTFGANGAVICFVFLYYANGFWSTAQPDGWGGMLVLTVVFLLLNSLVRPYWTMGAVGGLIAIAALFKPTFLLFAVLPMLHTAGEPVRWRERLSLTGVSLFALALTLGTSLLTLSHLSGGLGDFFDILRFIYKSYVPHRNARTELAAVWGVISNRGLLIPLLVAPIGIMLNHRTAIRRNGRLITTWVILTLLLVIIQGRYWPYHWIPADISLSALAGVIFAWLHRRVGPPERLGSRGNVVVPLICIFMLALPGASALSLCYEWPRYFFGFETRRQYTSHVMESSWDYPTFESLASYVSDHSAENDTVLMWGWDGLVNVLSERRSPTRFGYSYPLVTPGPLLAGYREQFMKDVAMSPPRYIIVDDSNPWGLTNQSGIELLHQFSQFSEFLYGRYQFAGRVGTFQLWRLAR